MAHVVRDSYERVHSGKVVSTIDSLKPAKMGKKADKRDTRATESVLHLGGRERRPRQVAPNRRLRFLCVLFVRTSAPALQGYREGVMRLS